MNEFDAVLVELEILGEAKNVKLNKIINAIAKNIKPLADLWSDDETDPRAKDNIQAAYKLLQKAILLLEKK